jgi:Nucleolar protein,Nop52
MVRGTSTKLHRHVISWTLTVRSSASWFNDSPNDPKIPNSIRYHITDIYLDELDKVYPLESADGEFSATIDRLIVPFKTLQKEGRDKTAKTKAKDLLEDPRLQEADSDDDSE